MNSKINTDNVFRDKELDQGFILRANEEVAKVLKTIIHGEAKSDKSMSISLLDPSKRCYGLNIDGKLYLTSLVDLPCIIEAQKTLDYKTFYKSTDAAQMLYIHNQCLEDIASRSQEDVSIFVNSFNPLTDDEQFL
jgi:transcription initiation factor TFIID subunit 7